MKSEDELISFEEWYSRRKVERELESSDDLFFELNKGLFRDKEALSVSEEADHNIE